jgi:hypothetical protein
MLTKVNRSLGFTLRKEDESVLGHYVRALVRDPALSDGRIRPGDKIVAVSIMNVNSVNGGVTCYCPNTGLACGHSEKPNIYLVTPYLFMFLTYFWPHNPDTRVIIRKLIIAELVKKFSVSQNLGVLYCVPSAHHWTLF